MIVKSIHLSQWASTLDSKGILPLLVRKLVFHSLNFEDIKAVDFPAEEDTYNSGYDGILKISKGNTFVPEGDSVWEFGTSVNSKTKANGDYQKRTENPLAIDMKSTVFVFLTPRIWVGKNEWANEKKAENIWKDVRCYDASDIEQWLDHARGVDYWMALHLKIATADIYTGEEFWNMWSSTDHYEFVPELLLGGRTLAMNELSEKFRSPKGSVTWLKAPTKDEALAFILATIVNLEDNLKASILSKTLIINDLNNFRRLLSEKRQLILVPKCNPDDIDLAKAKLKNHIIVIPRSSNSTKKSGELVLPVIEYQSFIEALKKMGIVSEKARQLSKNTARNITVLRRVLGISNSEPLWYSSFDKVRLTPMLLLSRFNGSNAADRGIVEKVTKRTYAEYEDGLRNLLALEETLLFYVNEVWRLISPIDSWIFLAKHITKKDLEIFSEVTVEVLGEHNPALDLEPGQRYMAAIYNAKPKYSGDLKKGMAETLIMMAVSAEEYGLNCGVSAESYVNSIVHTLLKDGNANTWRSLSENLMRLGEAAPSTMLVHLENLINSDELTKFFEVEDSILHKTSHLPYLLWTLEQLAWMPEHLSKCSLLLCKLIEKGPDKYPNSNTPLASLTSLYRSWYPQTLAPLRTRMKALEVLKKHHPKIAYNLFHGLISDGHDVAFNNSRMEWRLFESTKDVTVTNREKWQLEDFAISNIIELSSFDSQRLVFLVDKLDLFTNEKIEKALEHLRTNIPASDEEKAQVYHAFRKKIGRHRSFPDVNWSLPEDILEELDKTAQLFEPSDIVLKDNYLFEDGYPDFFEGRDAVEHRINREHILKKRQDYIKGYLKEKGLGNLIQLAKGQEFSIYYGEALAYIDVSADEEQLIYLLSIDKNEKLQQLSYQYIQTKERLVGYEAMISTFQKLREDGASSDMQYKFLLPLNTGLDLWKYIDALNDDEMEKNYWENKSEWVPDEEPIYKFAIDKFLNYNRTIAVLNDLGFPERVKTYKTDKIMEILRTVSLSGFTDPKYARLHNWSIKNIFSELDNRNDIDEDEAAKIELKYLFSLNEFNSPRKPKFLFRAMAKDPELFYHFISEVYVPTSMTDEKKQEIRAKRNQQETDAIHSKHKILENINVIPGSDSEGHIEEVVLKDWICKVRKLAKKNERLKSADGVIGKLLSRYPKGKHETWFSPVILEVLENINSHHMLLMFEIGISNSGGATVRSANAGGEIERGEAEFFDAIYNQTYVEFPNVSNVFRRLRDQNLHRAKRADEEALGEILDY